jgi:hypothetical protein
VEVVPPTVVAVAVRYPVSPFLKSNPLGLMTTVSTEFSESQNPLQEPQSIVLCQSQNQGKVMSLADFGMSFTQVRLLISYSGAALYLSLVLIVLI